MVQGLFATIGCHTEALLRILADVTAVFFPVTPFLVRTHFLGGGQPETSGKSVVRNCLGRVSCGNVSVPIFIQQHGPGLKFYDRPFGLCY